MAQTADAFLDGTGPAPQSAASFLDAPSEQETATVQAVQAAPQAADPGFGLSEAAMSLGTGMVAKTISDVAGLAATAYDAVTGSTDGDAMGFKQYVQDKLTYKPRTVVGQEVSNVAQLPGKAVGWMAEQTAQFYGDTLRAAGASPAVAAAVQDGIRESVAQAANLAGVMKGSKIPKPLSEAETLNAQNVTAAQNLGYKVPPSMIARAGYPGKVLESIGGQAGVTRSARIANQVVHNNLAADDIGLEEGQDISQDALERRRQQEYDNGYKPVRDFGKVNTDFQHSQLVANIKNGVDLSITSEEGKAALAQLSETLTPKYEMNPTTLTMDSAFDSNALVDKIQSLRARGNELYRGNEGRVGRAYKLAATGLEALIDRNVQKAVDTGAVDPNLLDNFRASRVQLAKINDVENSTNLTTGNVDAIKLGRIHDKNPNILTGGLRQIASFANAFPDVARIPVRTASVVSPLDLGLAEGAAGLAHKGLGAAAVGAVAIGAGRGIARAVSLKPWAQKSIMNMVNQNLHSPAARAIAFGSPLAFNNLIDTTQQDDEETQQ